MVSFAAFTPEKMINPATITPIMLSRGIFSRTAAKKTAYVGDKVKVTLRFRGRELAHVNASKSILDEFAKMLEDVAIVEKEAKFEGRSMIMFLTEKK